MKSVKNWLSCHLVLVFVWVVIGLTMLGVWLDGSRQHFIPCTANCGEVFIAMQQVENYQLYGFKYGLLEDVATSPDAAAHPYLYTHNVNIAGVLFPLFEAIGLTPFWLKQTFTLIAFGIGIFYVFRTTAFYTHSHLVGVIVLLLFCTEFDYVLRFGLNSLRAWHWLAIFGLLFYTGHLILQPRANAWLDRAAIIIFALVSFGIGYDFWIICFLISLFVLIFYTSRPLFSLDNLKLIGLVCVAFAIPLVLRQIQIAAVLGPTFWMLDLYYSAVIKVSLLSKILPIPTIAEIDQFYEAANILRPPATPATSFTEIFETLRNMLTYITIPTIGFLTFIIAICVGGTALIVALLNLFKPHSITNACTSLSFINQSNINPLGTAHLLAALILGMVVGLAIFAPVSLHIYLKHQFPLIAAPILLAKAVVLALVVQIVWHWRTSQNIWRWVALGVGCLLIVDHMMIQIDNLKARTALDVSWIEAVSARKEASFAVSWIPNSVSVFTDNWVVGLQPGQERKILQKLEAGYQPIDFSDLFLFGERNAKLKGQEYLQPDYWLYFPIDQLTPFDHPSPTCRNDYLTSLAQQLWSINFSESAKTENTWILPGQGPPGTEVSIGGRLNSPKNFVERVELIDGEEVVSRLIYNCQYNTYAGTFQIPLNAPGGVNRYQVHVLQKDGKSFIVGIVDFRVDASLPFVSNDSPPIRIPQPGIEQIVAENPALQIADRGERYVIIDLRPQYIELETKIQPELLPKTSNATATYIPVLPDKLEAGMKIIRGSQSIHTLNTGDLVLAGQHLFKVEMGKAIPLLGDDGQIIQVEEVGAWDQHLQAFAGLPAVFQNNRWVLDTSGMLPANSNSMIKSTTEADLLSGLWISPGDINYEIYFMQDESGGFIRIQANQDVASLLVTGQAPLPDLDNVPVSVRAQIRSNSEGREVLTLFDMVGPGEGRPHIAETKAIGKWNTLNISGRFVVWPSSGDSYSLGLYDVKAGDWFDVRELNVYIGRLP